MMGSCAVAGWFLLAPADYKALGMSIASAALSISNLEFWSDAGYFDTPAAEKPLLHTWSLGVEEQFYLVFPLYLILMARHLPRQRGPLTAALCLASLTFASIEVMRHPAAAFYLPHARLWELLAGSLLAMGVLPRLAATSARTGVAALGLVLIALPVFFYSDETIFPGLTALPPTIGAVLIIWSGIGGGSAVGRVLAARPLVFVGKISYSLYLWHFPLLAFGFYFGLGDPSPLSIAGLLALAVSLSILSWRFIEQPARRAGARFNWRTVARLAAGSVVAISSIGLALQMWEGFPTRLPMSSFQLIASQPLRNPDRQACFVYSENIAASDLCMVGDAGAAPSFVLWGDSHAETMRGALGAAAATKGRGGLFAGQIACPPLIGVVLQRKPECQTINEAIFHMIVKDRSIDTVVMVARWGWWAESRRYKREAAAQATLLLPGVPASDGVGNHPALAAGLEQTVTALLSAGKRVWLVGPVPEVGYDVPRYFYLRSLGFANALEIAPTRAEFDQRQHFVFAGLNDLAQRYPVGSIWPHTRLCNDVGCDIIRDGHLLYSDDDHLSVFGAHSMADLFAPVFD